MYSSGALANAERKTLQTLSFSGLENTTNLVHFHIFFSPLAMYIGPTLFPIGLLSDATDRDIGEFDRSMCPDHIPDRSNQEKICENKTDHDERGEDQSHHEQSPL